VERRRDIDDPADDDRPLTFRGRPLPAGFTLRWVTIPAGCARAFDPRDWVDELVVLEHGCLELEDREARRWRFVAGDVLCLDRMCLSALRNPGPTAVVLSAVSRGRSTDEFPIGPRSNHPKPPRGERSR
jgi:hypothetical protein